MALGRLVDITAPSVQSGASLDVALEALGTTADTWVTVINSGQNVVGAFTTSALIAGYRRALATNTERLSKLAGNAVPVELCVGPGAEVAGRTVGDAMLPQGTIVVTVERAGALLFVEGDTTLEPGDLVSALARLDEVDALRRALEGDVSSEGVR
ncbi:MAG: TrkA C-terminal domain-containing protein [Acidimicrobiales bacterium]